MLKYTYDALNRKTAEYATSATAANELASWNYDSLAKGQLTSSSGYTGGTSGSAYTEAITGYDALYQPTGTKTTLPAAVTGLNGSHTTTSTYTSVTGLLARIRTDRPARKIRYAPPSKAVRRSTDTSAMCGSRTPAVSRAYDEHDHENHDHAATGHAGTNPVASVPEPVFTCRRHDRVWRALVLINPAPCADYAV